MNPWIQIKTTILPLLIALLTSALSPTAQALAPPPDGGYPGANTAEGDGALNSLSPHARGQGVNNTALGYHTLFTNTTGSFNTATGSFALANNTANNNTANGYQALSHNTEGSDNTAIGYLAASSNLGDAFNGFGSFNTAVGSQALYTNPLASGNTAVGYQALFTHVGGVDFMGQNTAVGFQTLQNDTNGALNTAIGANALRHNTNGDNNVALGYAAGSDLTTGDNNIDIGAFVQGVAGESNTIRIGDSDFQTATYIAGISGVAGTGSVVLVAPSGKLGVLTSSHRFKDEIKSMDKASEAILGLNPVSFRYKKEIDPERTTQFGLVAEDVEKVNPDLIVRDRDGKPYTVRYEAVNAMLLNEFLKEHREVQELKKQVAALTAGLEKVSGQLELSKSAPRIVKNE